MTAMNHTGLISSPVLTARPAETFVFCAVLPPLLTLSPADALSLSPLPVSAVPVSEPAASPAPPSPVLPLSFFTSRSRDARSAVSASSTRTESAWPSSYTSIAFARALFIDYVWAFELVSLLLTIVIAGIGMLRVHKKGRSRV